MSRPKLDPAGYFRRIPLLPHQLTAHITAAKDVIVLCHLGVPRIDVSSWTLEIGGMVKQPRTLTYADLSTYRQHSIESVHQCAGSPLAPFEPTRRICNVRWTGVRLTDVLHDCGVDPDAKYLWATGMDHGDFNGVNIDDYKKDLPIERWNADVLIACELNGAPLPPENGFPARLVVPGFYGTNSVKWLKSLHVAATRADGPFTTRWYNDPIIGADGSDTGKTRPVWSIAPESVIVSPSPDAQIRRGDICEIWGWAWADGGVMRVELAFGEGDDWTPARLETRTERGWQRFSLSWRPQITGAHLLRSRAHAANGQSQPPEGHRNAIHAVPVHAI